MLRLTLACLLLNALAIPTIFAATPSPEPDPEPSPPGSTIEEGRYIITNRHSNLVLSVESASTSNGSNVVQDNFSNSLHQQWDITEIGSGTYSIRPAHSGKSLDVYEWIAENGADARQWEYLGGENQLWRINQDSSDYYNITSVFSGKALEAENYSTASGGNIALYSYWGGDPQLWSLELVDDTAPPNSGDRCEVANYDSRNPPSTLSLSGNTVTHDPTIIEENGTFYVLQTGAPADGLVLPGKQSSNLTNWVGTSGAFTQGNSPSWLRQRVPGVENLWAPDLSHFGGQFHLYYSVSTFGSNRSCIGHATRNSMASGSWQDRGPVICSNTSNNYNAIDPNIVVDDDGTPWLSFGSFWDGIKMIRLNQDGSRADSNVISIASRGGDAIEAPVIVKKCGFYYLFVSFDKCCDGTNSTYNIRVGRSINVTGPYYDKNGRRMLDGGGTSLVTGSYSWRGPGHNSILFTENNAYNMYHAYRAFTGEPHLRISEIAWDSDGWPVSAGP
ncbi:hypothetical protein NBRC116494_29610 [Aurantivibrio plasticivorans]